MILLSPALIVRRACEQRSCEMAERRRVAARAHTDARRVSPSILMSRLYFGGGETKPPLEPEALGPHTRRTLTTLSPPENWAQIDGHHETPGARTCATKSHLRAGAMLIESEVNGTGRQIDCPYIGFAQCREGQRRPEINAAVALSQSCRTLVLMHRLSESSWFPQGLCIVNTAMGLLKTVRVSKLVGVLMSRMR